MTAAPQFGGSPEPCTSSGDQPMFPHDSEIRVHRRVVGSITDEVAGDLFKRLDMSRALSADEVNDLLKSLPSREHAKPWQFWAPRLALAMGLAPKGIAQLDTRQLRFRGERVWIEFEPLPCRGGRPWRLRAVPVPSDLITAGFAQFAQARYFSTGTEGPLFPDLAEATRPGDAMQSWLRRATAWLPKVGQHAPTFADLRATCAQLALDGGASVASVEALMGFPVEGPDDRGGFDAEALARLLEERLVEAVEAVRLPSLDAPLAEPAHRTSNGSLLAGRTRFQREPVQDRPPS